MKLWGAVVRAFLLVMSLFFVAVTFVVTHDRAVIIVTAALLAVAGLFGVPALVALFTSFTGDEDILRTGEVASATVVSFRPTGWRYNRYYPIVQLDLSVSSGGAPYSVRVKQAIEPELLGRLSPGAVLPVRVDRLDRMKVVISSSQQPKAE